MNIVLLQGRVPFEPQYFEATEGKKSFATFTLAVNTGIKDEETKYYKEDLFRCTVSGGWADNLVKNWKANSKLIIDVYGKLFIGKDYEKDGEIIKGQPQIRVLEIHDYNTLDKTVIRAKVPSFENAINYSEGTGDKKSFARVKLSISTGIKDEENGFYKERIITAKMFGATADFFNSYYKAGDFVTIEGKYADGQDYEKDGEVIKAMPELLVSNVHGFPRRKDEEGATEGKKKAPGKTPGGSVKAGIGTKAKAPGAVPKTAAPKLGGIKKKPGLSK